MSPDLSKEASTPHRVRIQIDRGHYDVSAHSLTGAQLRDLPEPPISADRDLFEVRPGMEDSLVQDDTVVEMHSGLRFFTAPGRINPGSGQSSDAH